MVFADIYFICFYLSALFIVLKLSPTMISLFLDYRPCSTSPMKMQLRKQLVGLSLHTSVQDFTPFIICFSCTISQKSFMISYHFAPPYSCILLPQYVASYILCKEKPVRSSSPSLLQGLGSSYYDFYLD